MHFRTPRTCSFFEAGLGHGTGTTIPASFPNTSSLYIFSKRPGGTGFISWSSMARVMNGGRRTLRPYIFRHEPCRDGNLPSGNRRAGRVDDVFQNRMPPRQPDGAVCTTAESAAMASETTVGGLGNVRCVDAWGLPTAGVALALQPAVPLDPSHEEPEGWWRGGHQTQEQKT